MRLLTHNDIGYRFSERDWKQALRRYNSDNAEPNYFGYYCIYINNICVGWIHKCTRCPIRDPHKKVNSCTYWFQTIVGEELFSYLHLFDNVVMWDAKYDSEARQALKKLRDVLLKATKI